MIMEYVGMFLIGFYIGGFLVHCFWLREVADEYVLKPHPTRQTPPEETL